MTIPTSPYSNVTVTIHGDDGDITMQGHGLDYAEQRLGTERSRVVIEFIPTETVVERTRLDVIRDALWMNIGGGRTGLSFADAHDDVRDAITTIAREVDTALDIEEV